MSKDRDGELMTVSINDVSCPMLCGLCHAPIGYRIKGDAECKDIGCASCSNWDNIEEVISIVKQYVKDEGQVQLNRRVRDTARKIRFMTFEGKTVNDGTYRFIVDFKL